MGIGNVTNNIVMNEPAAAPIAAPAPDVSDSVINETEWRMTGIDWAWAAMGMRQERPGRFLPPDDEEGRKKYAAFIAALTVHPAVAVFPLRCAKGSARDLKEGGRSACVTLKRVHGGWQIVDGRRIRERCAQLGVLPSVLVEERDVIEVVASADYHRTLAYGERLSGAVKLMLMLLRREADRGTLQLQKRRPIPTQRARLQAAGTVGCRLGFTARVIEAASFVQEHGVQELWLRVFATKPGRAGFLGACEAAKIARLPHDAQRETLAAHAARRDASRVAKVRRGA